MDEHVEAGQENLASIEAFVARYSFPIDAFQLEAINHLAQGQSVLVAAPTGTGKTLLAQTLAPVTDFAVDVRFGLTKDGQKEIPSCRARST